MRPIERITIEARRRSKDFGKGKPEWDRLGGEYRAEVREAAGRLQRVGDQMEATHDVEYSIRYVEAVHSAWKDKQPLRITVLGWDERVGVKAMNRFRRGRLWWLKMGCVRS